MNPKELIKQLTLARDMAQNALNQPRPADYLELEGKWFGGGE